MLKVDKLWGLACACLLVACSAPAVPTEGPFFNYYGHEGHEVACSEGTINKVFIDETRDGVGDPLGGYQLWRVGARTETANTYEISDHDENCIFAFFLDASKRFETEEARRISRRKPLLAHPLQIVSSGRKSAFIFQGVELPRPIGTGVLRKAAARKYLKACVSQSALDSCISDFIETVRKRSAVVMLPSGTLRFFEHEVYYGEERIK